MRDFKEFLETSSLHGLLLISLNKGFTRLFWVVVVVLGFLGAGILMRNSVRSWYEIPVSTTIETRPIADLSFPVVTVCPPRKTYTNINYDLVTADRMELDKEFRLELYNYVVTFIQDMEYSESLADLLSYREDGRFTNWYLGHTEISLPYHYVPSGFSYTRRMFEVKTYATDGCIASSHFAETFDFDNFQNYEQFSGYLKKPINEDLVLLTEVELDSEGSETEGSEKSKMNRKVLVSSGGINITNLSQYSAGVSLDFERALSDKDLSKYQSLHI